ncbi:MAG: hypothetical protein ACSLFE_00465 [Gemmatimonadaceae bacterium]
MTTPGAARCWQDLSVEELRALRGYPLSGCDCSPCRSMRGYGIPDMPSEMLSGDPVATQPSREY